MRQIHLSAHGSYYQCFHIVWIPKDRGKILRGPLKDYIAQKLPEIQEHYPDVHIDTFNIQIDHIDLINPHPAQTCHLHDCWRSK